MRTSYYTFTSEYYLEERRGSVKAEEVFQRLHTVHRSGTHSALAFASTFEIEPGAVHAASHAACNPVRRKQAGQRRMGCTLSCRKPHNKADGLLCLGAQVCNANKISRSDITYVEAHGTGTVVGDAQELAAIDFMYGAGAGRTADSPLLIGSVKSNMGHCEGCSGLAGGRVSSAVRLHILLDLRAVQASSKMS